MTDTEVMDRLANLEERMDEIADRIMYWTGSEGIKDISECIKRLDEQQTINMEDSNAQGVRNAMWKNEIEQCMANMEASMGKLYPISHGVWHGHKRFVESLVQRIVALEHPPTQTGLPPESKYIPNVRSQRTDEVITEQEKELLQKLIYYLRAAWGNKESANVLESMIDRLSKEK